MKISSYFLLLLLFNCTILSCYNQKSLIKELDGKVVSITDGDTFTLLTEQNIKIKIRLHGIDCPEKRQDFGQVAKQKLSDLIFRKFVHAIKKDIDRYGRTVALVYDEQNNCINEEMLKAGLAWHYLKYDNDPSWTQIQDSAKKNGVGLWIQPNPTPPWKWRKK
jgi:endonuclease YncB( thermonuclease family)